MAIIAIDFDDTITNPSQYPIMGTIRQDAKIYIEKLYNDGHHLILWTCRSGKYIEEAISALKDNDMLKYFEGINTDFKSRTLYSRKICADYYIDDRALFDTVDWAKIYNYIRNKEIQEFGQKT